jgi:MFS family permease
MEMGGGWVWNLFQNQVNLLLTHWYVAPSSLLSQGGGRRSWIWVLTQPQNWSRTRKEIVYATILLTVASLAPLKMLLVTVASVTSTQLNVSYTATTALTGIPLIIGALAGMGARVLSQTSGKRGFLLSSTSLALIGALWNMHVYGSYAQFMVSRIFQGIGWGVFETLAGHVIDDLFFVCSSYLILSFENNTNRKTGT